MQLPSEKKRKLVILGVDVGTTNIKCFAYDQHANVLGKASEKVINMCILFSALKNNILFAHS